MADSKKVHFSKAPILKMSLWKFHGLAKTGKNIVRTNFHVPTCAGVPYIERNGDKGQLPSLIGVQKPPEFMKWKKNWTRLRELNADFSVSTRLFASMSVIFSQSQDSSDVLAPPELPIKLILIESNHASYQEPKLWVDSPRPLAMSAHPPPPCPHHGVWGGIRRPHPKFLAPCTGPK